MLSQQDLMELKQKQNGIQSSPAMSQNKADKRYLILTLEGEFEKVHYPLPLQFMEEVDMASMLKTFQRL
jgi:coiled-coil domain-containing protein 61